MARKTDDTVILQMLNEDKTQKEIAEHFGVSPAAICKRVKKLLNKRPDSLEKLTPKEQKFALAIADGQTQTNAALESYNCSSLASAKSIGTQLMAKPDIQTAVAEIMQESGLTRRYRVHRLKSHIEHPDPNVSLKGLDQSWKLDGAYTEKHIHAHIDIVELHRELKNLDAEILILDRELKEDYMAEIKKLHPQMTDEKVSEMAEKTMNTIFPQRKEMKKTKEELGIEGDVIEGEIIEGD